MRSLGGSGHSAEAQLGGDPIQTRGITLFGEHLDWAALDLEPGSGVSGVTLPGLSFSCLAD